LLADRPDWPAPGPRFLLARSLELGQQRQEALAEYELLLRQFPAYEPARLAVRRLRGIYCTTGQTRG